MSINNDDGGEVWKVSEVASFSSSLKGDVGERVQGGGNLRGVESVARRSAAQSLLKLG